MNANPRVANCAKYPLDFQCDKHWNQLNPTEDPKQAFCDECKQTVYLCVSLDDFEDQRYQGHCVAIPLKAAFLESGELTMPSKTTVLMGVPTPQALTRAHQEQLNLQAWWNENVLSDNLLP